MKLLIAALCLCLISADLTPGCYWACPDGRACALVCQSWPATAYIPLAQTLSPAEGHR